MNSRNLSKNNFFVSRALINPCLYKARVIFFLGGTFLAGSCSKSADGIEVGKGAPKVIAKVYDREVFASEIEDVTRGARTREDSIRLASLYLDRVALEKALLQKSIGSGLVDMTDIEAKTSEFRNNLINLRFEREYVKKNLDTVITENQMRDYFEKNKSSFVLSHDILLAYYVVIPSNTPKIGKLKDAMASDKPNDFEELKSQCLRYASTFSLDNKHWTQVPTYFLREAKVLADAARTKQVVTMEKEDKLHLIRVFDYKFAKQPSPFLYVETDIREILLNKRKMELLSKLNEQVLAEAKQNNKIEIY